MAEVMDKAIEEIENYLEKCKSWWRFISPYMANDNINDSKDGLDPKVVDGK